MVYLFHIDTKTYQVITIQLMSKLKDSRHAGHQNGISQHFTNRNTEQAYEEIGTHQPQGYRDSRANNRQKGKKSRPRTMSRHEALGLLEVASLHMQVAFDPLQTSHATNSIVKQ